MLRVFTKSLLLTNCPSPHRMGRRRDAQTWLSFCLTMALTISAAVAEGARVAVVRTPNGGIQPQAAVDNRGVVHLIYFKGEADGGDVFYVHRRAGETEFSKPIKVNSQSGSVTAMGTIRGAQLAIGKN